LPLGRPLAVGELADVAEGIREALEAEQQALHTCVSEQMQRFELEDQRRASARAGAGGEPSTADLQQFVRKLQDLAVNPSLHSLAVAGPPSPSNADRGEDAEALVVPMPITGGANVRRLKALISQRRRCPEGGLPALEVVPDIALGKDAATSPAGASAATATAKKPAFDPFFDDPFAM